MSLRLIQIACIIATAAILYAVRGFLLSIFDWGGPSFVDGFLVGAGFVIATIAFILWIDPSSRPRGSAEQKRFDDRAH